MKMGTIFWGEARYGICNDWLKLSTLDILEMPWESLNQTLSRSVWYMVMSVRGYFE